MSNRISSDCRIVSVFANTARAGLPLNGWTTLGVGLVVSSLSSFVAIWGLMRFLERFSTWPLVIYRALFGVLLIGGVYAGWF